MGDLVEIGTQIEPYLDQVSRNGRHIPLLDGQTRYVVREFYESAKRFYDTREIKSIAGLTLFLSPFNEVKGRTLMEVERRLRIGHWLQ